MSADRTIEHDHEPTFGDSESLERQAEPAREETVTEGASAIGGADDAGGELPGAGRETIGDAIGSTRQGRVGSGTPPDREQLGGGEPPLSTEDADPIGTYTPGESRD